jgi:peptidoglycan/LPS O-acetylase OafA/YrhL
MKYRPEIDGLRALAVLPILFFHAGFSTFGGGYVGVDVFFVISGYLITSIILGEKQSGSFSLARFYERRARRILPALFVVMFACLPFAWLWLLPNELEDFTKSQAYVSVFLSNILFHKQSGYFDTVGELKPLLHTWSLAVEEQYYLLFPVFLLLIWRWGKRFIFGALLCISIASLSYAHWLVFKKPETAFYLLTSRIWEILLGAMIAIHLSAGNSTESRRQWIGDAASSAGLLLIVYAIFGFDKSTPFPSYYALVPTLGAALIILYANPQTLTGRLLGSKLPVALGLISYSVYLWHQPLFAFARHRSMDEPGTGMLLALICATVGLGYLSWRYVEQPFRNRNWISRKTVVVSSLFIIALFLAIGTITRINGGFPGRVGETINRIYLPKAMSPWECELTTAEVASGRICVIGDRSVEPTIAILGDSHSIHLLEVLAESLSQRKRSALVYSQPWCAPLIDVGTDFPLKKPACREYTNTSFEAVKRNASIKLVILAAQWSNYTKGYRWNDFGLAFYTDRLSSEKSVAENARVFERALGRTRDALLGSGKRVLLVKSLPEYEFSVPKYLGKLALTSGVTSLPENRRITPEKFHARNAEAESAFAAVKLQEWASVVDPLTTMCRSGVCDYLDGDGNVLYTDSNHLSYFGAKIIVDEMAKVIPQ